MGKFNGKKILFLGTSVGTVDMINYAKFEGAYTIITDYLPKEKSTGKQYADMALNYSTADTDSIIKYMKDNNIDSVFAGVSEFNLQCAKKISEKMNIPFYYTEKQWNTFMNKQKFRETCEKYNVTTPKTFFSGSENDFSKTDKTKIEYPVIIKPVDGAANIGISVCYKADTLNHACKNAFQNSNSGNIIIEQFIHGPEISVTYVVKNGVCKLVGMGTKFAYESGNGLKALPNAYVYPSAELDEYLKSEDVSVKEMILGENIDNCSIFFQGIYSDNKFYIFEAGLRLEGTASYRMSELTTGQNYMKFMIDNSFGIQSDFDIDKANADYCNHKAIIFTLISKGGKIKNISDLSFINNLDEVKSFEQRHFVGDEIPEDGSLRQIMFRFIFINNDIQKIIECINMLKKKISVIDENGNEMLIKDFNPEQLKA